MTLETAAWIEHAADILTTEIVDAAEKSSDGGWRVVDAEINKAAFESYKRMHVPVFAEIHLRAEFAVQGSQTGAANSDDAGSGVPERLGESLIEIVTHFSFQLNVAISNEADASAYAGHVRVRLVQTQIVSKNADLNVLGFLSGG